jgi:hypothetical protein
MKEGIAGWQLDELLGQTRNFGLGKCRDMSANGDGWMAIVGQGSAGLGCCNRYKEE